MLDEDALEEMIRRQQASDDEPAPAAQLTEESDEFEVYERPQAEPAAETAPPEQVPRNEPAPAQATPAPPAPQPSAQAAPRAPQVLPTTHDPAGTPVATPPAPPGGDGPRLAIVQCQFNQQITDVMAQRAAERAQATGCTVTRTVQCPGVYDAPFVARMLADHGDVDAIVVVGVVIKGDTDHDQVITHATARSLQQVALAEDLPVGLGIIGPGMSWAEAEARIGNAAHAVDAALAMIRLST